MKEAEKKVKHETPPGGTGVDNFLSLFEGDEGPRTGTHRTPTPSSASAKVTDETAGIAKSTLAVGCEWPQPE